MTVRRVTGVCSTDLIAERPVVATPVYAHVLCPRTPHRRQQSGGVAQPRTQPCRPATRTPGLVTPRPPRKTHKRITKPHQPALRPWHSQPLHTRPLLCHASLAPPPQRPQAPVPVQLGPAPVLWLNVWRAWLQALVIQLLAECQWGWVPACRLAPVAATRWPQQQPHQHAPQCHRRPVELRRPRHSVELRRPKHPVELRRPRHPVAVTPHVTQCRRHHTGAAVAMRHQAWCQQRGRRPTATWTWARALPLAAQARAVQPGTC